MGRSGVVQSKNSIESFNALLYEAVIKKLGDDRAALKAWDVGWYIPPNDEAAADYAKLGKRLFNVVGALGLNSGEQGGWKAFNFQMEEGLTLEEDEEVAEQLAHQCLICVSKMKREASTALRI